MMSRPIYLDYNATTPHDPEVIARMLPFLEEHFGNPSSTHPYGSATREAVGTARGQAAALLNCRPEEVVFTSGGTESNNHAIRGAVNARRDRGTHIITSQVEHPAVTEVCRHLAAHGFAITYVPVDRYGLISVSDVEKAIRPDTILISIMHANNEVGTIQPIAEIAKIARERQILVHTDAAQSVGKIPVDVGVLGVDLLSLAGHKLYAPKGVGLLYIREGLEIQKFMLGAGQEKGRRAGTENVLEIAGLGQACEVARRDLAKNAANMKSRRDQLENALRTALEDLRVNGHPELRLPNTLSVSFRGVDANALLTEVESTVAASAGAACHSGGVDVSHVLRAMNVPLDWARGTVRFSTGKMTTSREIDTAADIIADAVTKIRERQPARRGAG